MSDVRVEIHWMSLDRNDEIEDRLAPLLSAEEIARAFSFRLERDRKRYIIRRARLRQLLAERLGGRAQDMEISLSPLGKPFVAASDLHFSLSHSNGLALYVFARGAELGCDVERHAPCFATEDIAGMVFSEPEMTTWRSLPATDQPNAFFRCWTCREAIAKASGQGLVNLPVGLDLSLLLKSHWESLTIAAGWLVMAFRPFPMVHAAIAVAAA